jgi:nitronate monooxygenase
MPSPRTTAALRAHLRLPWIAATMLYVSGAALVAAACRAGIIGAFPALSPHVARRRTLDDWFCEIKDRLADTGGRPWSDLR